jgi:hypothetical protein
VHALLNGIRVNDRRKDVPAKLLSSINALVRREAVNDAYLG